MSKSSRDYRRLAAKPALVQNNQQNNTVKPPQPLVIDGTNKHVLGGYFSLGLNNFYKAILSIFAKVGIKVANKNDDAALYSEGKIGVVLKALYKTASNEKCNTEEKSYANNFKLNSNQQVKLQKLLFHHFPMLGPVMANESAFKVSKSKKSNVTEAYDMAYGATLPECLDVISTIAQGLVDCRNSQVHYNPYNSPESLDEQYLLQEKIVRYLDKTFVASRRLDKKRNNIDTIQLEFLTGTTKNLDQYTQEHMFYPRYKEITEGGKKKHVERDDFFYKISGKEQLKGSYPERKDNNCKILSGFGLCYFCALFLSKSQTKQMLSDIKLFERSPYTPESNDIIRDIMCIYRIRAPRGKKKFESSDDKITLALDILNELRKCPRELFDVLTPEGQKYFEDKVNMLPSDQSQNNSDTSNVVKRFRSIDRFPHLAMRYIDETKLFDNIRFQVQLGKFRFKFYDKTCINGETVVRSLQKEINGFGRLQEIEEKRKQMYGDKLQPTETRAVKIEGDDLELDLVQFAEDTKDSRPYITDSRAFYNIHNNRIGLYWEECNNNGRCFPIKGDYIPRLQTVDDKADVKMPAPMAMLSIYELPAMIFYQYLLSMYGTEKERKDKSVEKIIINKYYKLKQLFTDVVERKFVPVSDGKEQLSKQLKEKYDLKQTEIPDKLVEYLLDKGAKDQSARKLSSVKYHLMQRLQKSIRRKIRYEEDRKKIGNKDNKYAKKGYADVRHGALARYLSQSFIEWQPTNNDGKDKLAGLNFSKLQSELATFNSAEKFDGVRHMLSLAKMLNGPIAHPFLNNVVCKQVRNIEELYLLYLKEEIKYLKTFFDIKYKESKQKDDNNIDFEQTELRRNIDIAKIPFIHGKARWEERNEDYYRDLAKRYLEVDNKQTAIWLPDGIFTASIVDILKEHANGCLSMTDETLNNNVAYLINTYFEKELNDKSQEFYRSYDISKKGNVNPNQFAHVYDLFNILNNKKKNNALVAVPMTSSQIKDRFTKKAMGWDGKPITVFGSNKEPAKDYNGKKQIHEEINDYINRMTHRDKGNHKTLDDAKEAMKRRLTRYINEVKDNERTIRRYKTQDMILFLIAKNLMAEYIKDKGADGLFKLSNVCGKKFLSQPVDLKYSVQVDNKTVSINQENMALKNYGEFYQLQFDGRLKSLLKKLVAVNDKESTTTVEYNYLMGELTQYDRERSHVFSSVHQLEEQAFLKFKIFLNNPCDKHFYKDNDRSNIAKRNNFRSMLNLLEEGDMKLLDEEERELIVSIRNAFSHNHYDKIDFDKIATGDELSNTMLLHKGGENNKKVQLTTIAALIVAKLQELQKNIENPKK